MPLYYKSRKFKTLFAASVLIALISVFFIKSFARQFSTISIVKNSLEQNSEIAKLKATVLRLRLALNNTNNILQENQRLKQMLDLSKKSDDIFIGAQVIAKSPFDWEQRVKIDKGNQQNIAVNDLVLDHNGFLLGKIESVDKDKSWVLLLSDPEFKISVLCNDEHYLLSGNSRRNGRLLYVPYDDKIKKGDKIILRKSSLQFPNIPVAEVLDVSQDRNFLTADVDVTFASDPQDVSLVFVVSTRK